MIAEAEVLHRLGLGTADGPAHVARQRIFKLGLMAAFLGRHLQEALLRRLVLDTGRGVDIQGFCLDLDLDGPLHDCFN